MAKGRQINVRGGGKNLGVQKLQGAQKAYKTVKKLYFVGAPFEFCGRAPFKLITPLIFTLRKQILLIVFVQLYTSCIFL